MGKCVAAANVAERIHKEWWAGLYAASKELLRHWECKELKVASYHTRCMGVVRIGLRCCLMFCKFGIVFRLEASGCSVDLNVSKWDSAWFRNDEHAHSC